MHVETKNVSFEKYFETFHLNLLASVGHLCDLQGLFSEIKNLRTVNRIELQLMST